MTKRIAAIAFIFICTTIAWFILANTINTRTYSSDDELKHRVSSTWGTASGTSAAHCGRQTRCSSQGGRSH